MRSMTDTRDTPECPSCGGRDWQVTREETITSVASINDPDGPFKNEERTDGDLIGLTFSCELCEAEATDSIRDYLEDIYYETA
jgi:hypothetical protein